MVKAVIFDLDDTLISERQYIESGYQHIAKFLSKKLYIEQKRIYQLLIGLFKENPRYVFNRLYEKLEMSYTNKDIRELVEEYRNHFPKIDFYDDVIPCLDTLKKNNIKTGIITDGFSTAQRKKLEAVKAFELFNEVIITDEIGREYWKPHPKAFEMIQEILEVEFCEMMYVGDNPRKDFYISSVYPIKTIRIYRDGFYTNMEYFKNIRESFSIRCLDELILLINYLSK